MSSRKGIRAASHSVRARGLTDSTRTAPRNPRHDGGAPRAARMDYPMAVRSWLRHERAGGGALKRDALYILPGAQSAVHFALYKNAWGRPNLVRLFGAQNNLRTRARGGPQIPKFFQPLIFVQPVRDSTGFLELSGVVELARSAARSPPRWRREGPAVAGSRAHRRGAVGRPWRIGRCQGAGRARQAAVGAVREAYPHKNFRLHRSGSGAPGHATCRRPLPWSGSPCR